MADNPGPNAGTPGGPTQPNPSGNIQGTAQRAAVSPPATTAGVTQPGAATVPTAAQNDVVDLQFNGKTVVKIRLPESFDIRGAYVQFEKDHAHVTDKLGAFPTSFVGDLVHKHGGIQVPPDTVAGRVEKLRVSV